MSMPKNVFKLYKLGQHKGFNPEMLCVCLILHGVYDECGEALKKALDLITAYKDNMKSLEIYPLLLLSLKEYQKCYDILKLRINSALIVGQMRNHCPFKNTVGIWTFEVDVVKTNDVFEDVDWLARRSLYLFPSQNHFLHYMIPVIIVKLSLVQNLRREKMIHFWTLLLGTHPRLGQDSPIGRISGHTPIIQKIFFYSSEIVDLEIDAQLHALQKQLELLISACKIRRLLMEILRVSGQEDLQWRCRSCRSGQDCCPVLVDENEEEERQLSWEKQMRYKNPLSFVVLQKALMSVVRTNTLLKMIKNSH